MSSVLSFFCQLPEEQKPKDATYFSGLGNKSQVSKSLFQIFVLADSKQNTQAF
jgi:hypothetical protein